MMYSSWSITELTEELQKRGASVHGSQADLIKRLESYDRNFGRPKFLVDDEPVMFLPPDESYSDVNSNTILPPLNKTHIRHYLSFTHKQMEDAVKSYETHHLVSVESCISNTETYIRGLCRNIQNLHYEVNVKLDQHGNIMEAHCACLGGRGTNATCSHVSILLLGIENMVTRKVLFLHNACTQYSSKIQKLPKTRQLPPLIYEPYPIKKINRQEYNARIRELILNYPGDSTMPIKQMYKPASAIESDPLSLDEYQKVESEI